MTDERRGGAVSPNMNSPNEFRDLNPYRNYAERYRVAGWHGPLPIPYKEKKTPPDKINGQRRKFTGGDAAYPTESEIDHWCNDGKQYNICIRLAGVDNEYEIIGIDVDHYFKDGQQKLGGDQLKELETRLGKLPDTWISSARVDGISGTRYFRVPRHKGFRGKAAKEIDIVSKGHKFSVVFPSIHPEEGLGTYWWFPPGTPLTLEGREAWQPHMALPDARQLPILDEVWWMELSDRGRPFDPSPMDLDSTIAELEEWADRTFGIGEACDCTRKLIAYHKKQITENATSHDILKNAHWNLLMCAFEGHLGIWREGLKHIEDFYKHDVWEVKRDELGSKRGIQEAENEVFRSRAGALRKIKKKSDTQVEMGLGPLKIECNDLCRGIVDEEPDWWWDIHPVIIPTLMAVNRYDMNDTGNAEHMRDLFTTYEDGPLIRFVFDWQKWIIWDDDQNRWIVDNEIGSLIRNKWDLVIQRQKSYVAVLKTRRDGLATQASTTGQGMNRAGTGALVGSDWWRSIKLHDEWAKFILRNGDNYRAEQAIKRCAKLLPISSDDLDFNRRLLAVSNGVLELKDDGVVLREQKIDDMITMNAGIEYNETPNPFGAKLWKEFLDRFLPDPEVREIVQVGMGYSLLGGNPRRALMLPLGQTSSGKSTFSRACYKAVGDYGGAISKQMFQSSQFKPTMLRNAKKRIVVCNEFDNNSTISTAAFKEITGNVDEVEVQRKGIDEVKVNEVHFTPWIPTNLMPKFSDPDLAIERRLYPIEFNETISHEDERGEYGEIIEQIALESVLLWQIEGYKMYIANGGLIRNELTKKWINKYMRQIDVYSTFIDECLEEDAKGSIENQELKQFFNSWMYVNDYKDKDIPSTHTFTTRLRALGLKKPDYPVTPKGKPPGRYWLGIKLKTQQHQKRQQSGWYGFTSNDKDKT